MTQNISLRCQNINIVSGRVAGKNKNQMDYVLFFFAQPLYDSSLSLNCV